MKYVVIDTVMKQGDRIERTEFASFIDALNYLINEIEEYKTEGFDYYTNTDIKKMANCCYRFVGECCGEVYLTSVNS